MKTRNAAKKITATGGLVPPGRYFEIVGPPEASLRPGKPRGEPAGGGRNRRSLPLLLQLDDKLRRMSYVLEGIVVPVAETAATDAVADCRVPFDVIPLGEEISILARPRRPAFDEAVCELASRLSNSMGVALLVRWDDRIGTRETRVYRDGSQTYRFANGDELYVVLDDEGMPLRDGRKYQETELEGLAGEFGVFQNALELGCAQSKFCSWHLLHDFIKRQG